MKTNKLISLLGLVALSAGPAFAQSTGEKVKDGVNDTGREIKKGGHRVEEALCTGTKAECAKEKMKNRGVEAKDATKDKATELKDKVDADGK